MAEKGLLVSCKRVGNLFSMGFTGSMRFLLVFVLVLQMVLLPVVPALAANGSDNGDDAEADGAALIVENISGVRAALAPGQRAFFEFTHRLGMASGRVNLASASSVATALQELGPSPDPFSLRGQSFVVNQSGSDQRFALGQADLARPQAAGPRGSLDISIETDPSTGKVQLVLSRPSERGHPRHVISGIEPRELIHDLRGDFVLVEDVQGKVFALDMSVTHSLAFQAPVPLIPVADAQDLLAHGPSGERPESGSEAASAGTRVHMEVLTRTTNPHLVEGLLDAADNLVTEGDVILSVKGHDRGFAVMDRTAIMMKIQKGLLEVAMQATIAQHSISSDQLSLNDTLAQFAASLHGGQEKASDLFLRAREAGTPFAEMMGEINRIAGSAVVDRATTGLPAAASHLRNRMSLAEWRAEYERLLKGDEAQRAAAETELNATLSGQNPEKPAGTLAAVRNAFSQTKMISGMARLGRFLTSPAALFTGAVVTADQLFAHGALLQGISLALKNALYPSIINDASYRVPLALSATLQFLEIGAIYGVAAAVTKYLHRDRPITSGAVINTVVAGSLKVFALALFPVIPFVAKFFARQHNLFASLKYGVLSGPSVNAPWSGATTIQERGRQVNDQVARRHRLADLARTMATAVVAERHGVDPVSLLTQGKIGEGDAAVPLTDTQWEVLAHDLYYGMKDAETQETLGMDLKAASAEELEAFRQALGDQYEIAKRRYVQLQESPWKRRAAVLHQRWRSLREDKLPRFLYAAFGPGLFETLWHAKADEFVASQSWRQFVIDYGFSIPLQLLWGERANLSDPANLGVRHTFPYTSVPMIADNQEQIAIYLGRSPAENLLVFNSGADRIRVTKDARGSIRFIPLNEFEASQEKDPYRPFEVDRLDRSREQAEPFVPGLKRYWSTATDYGRAQYLKFIGKKFFTLWKTWQGQVMTAAGLRLTVGGGWRSGILSGIYLASIKSLYGILVKVWAYGWPWPVLTRSLQLYDADANTAYQEFVNHQVQMGMALRIGDEDAVKRHRDALAEIYGRGSAVSKTLLDRYIKAVAPEKSVAGLSGSEMLELTQVMPPVYKSSNGRVGDLVVWGLGAIPTTLMALKLLNLLYSPTFDQHPLPFMARGLLQSAVGLTALYAGNSLLNKVWNWGKRMAEKVRTALASEESCDRALK